MNDIVKQGMVHKTDFTQVRRCDFHGQSSGVQRYFRMLLKGNSDRDQNMFLLKNVHNRPSADETHLIILLLCVELEIETRAPKIPEQS